MSKDEPQVSRRAKIRGGLPGDQWRDYVSSGARHAYDAPLAPGRAEAHQLRRKGRLVAAHRAEKRAYRIRVRGYDRKHRGGEKVTKGYSSETRQVGPYRHKKTSLRLGKPSATELRTERIKAIGSAVGASRLPMLLLAGSGGAVALDALNDTKKKTTKVLRNATGGTLTGDTGGMEKAWTRDDVLGVNTTEDSAPRVSLSRDGALRRPRLSTTYFEDLGDEHPEMLRLPPHRKRKRKALVRAVKDNPNDSVVDVEGSEYKVTKAYEITAASMVHDIARRPVAKAVEPSLVEISKGPLGAAKNLLSGAKSAYSGGGVSGLNTFGQQAWRAPRASLGGTAFRDQAAIHGGTAGKVAAGLGIGGATVGGGLLARRGAQTGLGLAKKKAKKLAMYGALGVGGAAAGGAALGNMATNR